MRLIFLLALFNWEATRDYLAKHWLIGASASIGTSVVGYLAIINPLLQFLGLCVGLFVGTVTAWAKVEEIRDRRRNKALIEDYRKKEIAAANARLNGKEPKP